MSGLDAMTFPDEPLALEIVAAPPKSRKRPKGRAPRKATSRAIVEALAECSAESPTAVYLAS